MHVRVCGCFWAGTQAIAMQASEAHTRAHTQAVGTTTCTFDLHFILSVDGSFALLSRLKQHVSRWKHPAVVCVCVPVAVCNECVCGSKAQGMNVCVCIKSTEKNHTRAQEITADI